MPLSRPTRHGATLLELLITVALIVSVVAYMLHFFPKSSRAIVINRQHLASTQLAQSQLQTLKKIPYDLLDVTSENAAFFPSGIGTAAGQCDCETADFSAIPADTITT